MRTTGACECAPIHSPGREIDMPRKEILKLCAAKQLTYSFDDWYMPKHPGSLMDVKSDQLMIILKFLNQINNLIDRLP